MSCQKIQPFSSQISLASNNRMQNRTKHVENGLESVISAVYRCGVASHLRLISTLKLDSGSFVCAHPVWFLYQFVPGYLEHSLVQSMPWYFVILWEGSLGRCWLLASRMQVTTCYPQATPPLEVCPTPLYYTVVL